MSEQRVIRSKKVLSVNLVLLILIAAAGYWGYSVLHPKAQTVTATQTTTVTTGNVQSTVSASGKVISPGDIGVAPLVSGQLKKLYVTVGQHVQAGQDLAQLDDTNLKLALANANVSLIQAKASANNAIITLQNSQASVDTAKQNVLNQQATNSSNAITYQAAVDAAKKTLDDAKSNAQLNAQSYQSTVDNAQATLNYASFQLTNYVYNYSTSNSGITLSYDYCTSNYSSDSGCAQFFTYYNSLQSSTNSFNSAVASQTLNLQKDAQNLAGLQVSYDNAVKTQQSNLKKDQQSLDSLNAAVTTAQNNLTQQQNSQNVNGSVTLAQAQLQIAQTNYDIAIRNLDSASIKAPVAGDIASIATSIGGNVSTNTTAATNTTSASGFIVLTNTTSMRIYSSFSEADAAKVKVGQNATFTFDALPNASATGKVIQVDQLPTTSGGATTYGAVMSIDNPVSGLKVGMTSAATVIVGEALNVLQVSAQAVTSRGGNSFVNLITTDSKGKEVRTRTPVVVGLQGDSTDEIQSGLKEGDKVAIATTNRSTTSANGFPNGGVPQGFGSITGTGGLGNGGFGGGGGGGRG